MRSEEEKGRDARGSGGRGIINSQFPIINSPRGLRDTGDVAVRGEFPEADAADSKESHVSVAASAELTTIVDARREFRLLPSALVPHVDCEVFLLAVAECETSHER